MQRHVLMFAGLCLVAVFGTALMRPGPSIQFEVELASIEPDEALERLARADLAIAATENIALLHAQLALNAADTDAVRDALRDVEGSASLTALIEEQLSEAARIDGDLAQAIRHLDAAHVAEPNTARRLRLGGWLYLARETAAELALLESVAPSMLTLGEAERLAQLLQQVRRFDDLEAAYTLLAEKPDRETDTFRHRLIDLQVESGRTLQAVSTVLRWFDENGRKPGPIELAVPVMITRGSIDEAFYLATVYMDAAHEDSHVMIQLFARSGHRAIAIELQNRWLRNAQGISPAGWQTLVGFANTTGDPRGLRSALSMVDPLEVEPSILRDALSSILRYQGVDALIPYRSVFSPELLEHAPLLGAAWMNRQGRQEETADYLMLAASHELADWQVHIWLQIARDISGGPAYRALLVRGTGDPRIDGALGAGVISAAQPVQGQ